MKKKIVLIISITIAVIAVGAMLYASYTLKQQEKELNKHLIELNYNTLKEKIDNKESFILLISKSDCSFCELYKPTFKKVLHENDIYAYEIKSDKLETKEEVAFLNSIATVTGTPTTVFISEGEETATSHRIVGNSDRQKIITRLKALGYIEE